MLPGAATGESGHTECSEAYDPANRSLGNTDRSRSPAQKLEEGEGDGEAGRLESILGPELDRLKLSEIPRVTDDLQPRQSSGVISPISTAQSKISGSSESHPVSPGPGENSGPALFRPGSNRRGSIDSIVKMVGNAKHSVRSVRKPKTDKILREPPEWLTPQLVRKTQIRLSTISSAKHIVALRSENAVRQTEQDSWAVLTWALGHPEEANEPLSGEELAEIVSSDKDMSTRSMPTSVAEKKIFEVMRKRQKAFCQKHGDGAEVGAVLMPGPVGDTPMHQCFLLGMVNLGKKIVEAFYFHPDLLNVPFANDLQVCCNVCVCVSSCLCVCLCWLAYDRLCVHTCNEKCCSLHLMMLTSLLKMVRSWPAPFTNCFGICFDFMMKKSALER